MKKACRKQFLRGKLLFVYNRLSGNSPIRFYDTLIWKWEFQLLRHVQLFVTPRTVAQAPPSMRFSMEWVSISFFRGSSWPRDQTQVSCIAGRLYHLSHQGTVIYLVAKLFKSFLLKIFSVVLPSEPSGKSSVVLIITFTDKLENIS